MHCLGSSVGVGVLYIIVEFLGGLAAGGFFLVTVPAPPSGARAGAVLVVSPGPGVSNTSALFMEMLASFILVLVVYRVAAAVFEPVCHRGMTPIEMKQVRNLRRQFFFKKMYVPFGIGGALGMLAYASGYISGGAYNPARALGGCVAGKSCGKIWIYLVGDFVGGVLGGLFHWVVFEIPNKRRGIEVVDEYDAIL